jgi:protein-tyrosine phosphatase
MAAQAYWIKGPWRGRLAIVPRPRGGEWLKDEVCSWRAAGIDAVGSFLTPDEVIELDLKAERELCEAQGIRFISFAIPDRGVPASKLNAATLVRDLEQSLARGDKIALHCRQSVGRSALIAAYLIVDSGEDSRSAFERISAARGGRVPDTSDQEQWVADRAAEDRRTKGERLFETYLRLQGITNYELEKSHPGKTKKPDYSVTLDREYLFEVKDFNPTDILNAGAYDPHSRIRRKIEEGREKFREYKGWPCCLVLYDNQASLIDLEDPGIMVGAMEGNFGWRIEYNPELGGFDSTTVSPKFHGGGKMNRPQWSEPQNTTISALITLRYVEVGQRKHVAFYKRPSKQERRISPAEILAESVSRYPDFDQHERQLGVITWENLSAEIPFDRALFCGPYDERYVRDGERPKRVFVGSEIAALEELEGPPTSLRERLR